MRGVRVASQSQPAGGLSLRRLLAIVVFLYAVEGYPMALFRDVWPVYLREAGMPLRWIGLVSGLYLAWSIKPLWSPLIDRFGERRQWIAGALLTMAALQFAIPALDPGGAAAALFLVLAGICIASATQDIAIDAYTIGLTDTGREGPVNSARVIAYRLSIVVFGAGPLLVADRLGWAVAHTTTAVAAIAMAAFLLACPRVPVPEEARRDVLGAFRPWARRGGVVSVLLFVLFFRLSDMAIGPMIATFWVDSGLSKSEMAFVRVTLGSIATMVGAVLGGWLVARLGVGRALPWVGVLAIGSNLGYAAAAAWPESGRAGIFAASVVESLCSGIGVAGFMSFLMRICDKNHAAVQYATLTGLYALPGTLAGAVSGAAVEALGYAPWFAITAAISVPAFAFLPAARRWARLAEEADEP